MKKTNALVDVPDVSVSRVERKRAERMDNILKIAAQVFAEKGYERTNLEEIAARANMRGPSLYHYVTTKEELYLRCVENLGSEIFARLEAIANSSGPPLKRLRLLFREQLLTQLRDYYPDYAPMVVTIRFLEPEFRARVEAIRHRHISIFTRIAEEAAAAGSLKGEDWRIGLRLAFGSLGFLHEWYRPDGALDAEQMADRITAIFLRMLSGRGSAGTAKLTNATSTKATSTQRKKAAPKL
jgi:AcrR family transcriptional regulator